MEIVINISEELYDNIINTWEKIHPKMHNALKNGTVLPKGHGKLGDLDEVETRINGFINNDKTYVDKNTLVREQFILDGIKETRSIIEADKS